MGNGYYSKWGIPETELISVNKKKCDSFSLLILPMRMKHKINLLIGIQMYMNFSCDILNLE